jgi:hypothetical protein
MSRYVIIWRRTSGGRLYRLGGGVFIARCGL